MEFTDEESAQLVGMFRTLGVKPKSDSPEDLKRWMQSYLESQALGSSGDGVSSQARQSSSTVVTQNPR